VNNEVERMQKETIVS